MLNKEVLENLQVHFKKLMLLGTDLNAKYIHKKFKELYKECKLKNYISKFFLYKGKDVYDRNFNLYGKFYDAMISYQRFHTFDVPDEYAALYEWFVEYKVYVDDLCQNITNILNDIFPKSKYIFQENNPIRISSDLSTGTPLHQDSMSITIPQSDIQYYKNGSYDTKPINDSTVMMETAQHPKIFNCNFTIYEEHKEQTMRICEHTIDNINEKSYFYRIKSNFDNEAFLFNPSNQLHYRTNQFKGLSIRGDLRIIELNDYNKSNLANCTGPRMNSKVCFATENDCRNVNSTYNVFMNKIYE